MFVYRKYQGNEKSSFTEIIREWEMFVYRHNQGNGKCSTLSEYINAWSNIFFFALLKKIHVFLLLHFTSSCIADTSLYVVIMLSRFLYIGLTLVLSKDLHFDSF